MRGSLKISPGPLIRAQHGTYIDARTGAPRVLDYLLFDGLPFIVLAVCIWQNVRLSEAAAGALLAVSGILGALLFGVMIQLLERAMDWVDAAPSPRRETSDHADFVREVAANAGYASLVCVAAAIVFVVATTTRDLTLELASAVGLALAAHLVLVLLMVIRRVFALTENRLIQVRTGSTHEVVPHRRRRAGRA